MIHFAGVDIQIGPLLRQRCSWCGEVLVEYNLLLTAVPEGQEGRPGTWPISSLVMVDGGLSYVVEHTDGEKLPENTCFHHESAND